MSPAIAGALVGAALGLANLIVLSRLAESIELKAKSAEQKGRAGIVRAVAWADLLVFPVVGYFVGPMVL
jgi:hypothetical protein